MSTPFLLPAIFLALGILVGLEYQVSFVFLSILGIIPWFWAAFQKYYQKRKRWEVVATLFLFFFIGLWSGNIVQKQRISKSFDQALYGNFEAQVNEVYPTKKGTRLMLTLTSINDIKQELDVCLWTKNKQFSEGDVIRWTGYLNPVTDSLRKNRSFFQWLYQKGFTATAFSDKLNKIGSFQNFSTQINYVKRLIINQIENKFYSEETRGLAIAILLGDKSGLNDEMKNDFSVAGAAHILAVSGMHVQLILTVLLFLLSRFPLVIRILIPMFIVVFYGFLAGASPAVSRAVIMGVLYLLACFFKKDLPLANSLALTLMIQLFWDPFAIKDLGLQLSYLAIAGILWIAPYIPAYKGKSKFQQWISENIKISIAAQFATLPLILFHFGQFPVYFLITNLILVPIGNIATILGFIFIPISGIFQLSDLLAYAASFSFDTLIYLAHLIASLPFASIQGFYLGSFATVLLFISMGTFILYKNQIQLISKA